MTFRYSPFILPLLVTGLIAVGLVFYVSRMRSRPGATPLLYLSGAAAIWALGYALEIGGGDLYTKMFWAKAQYIGIVGVPLAWMAYSLQYTDRGEWLTRRRLVYWLIIPLITLFLAFTTERHGLIWKEIFLDESGQFLTLGLVHGSAFWVYWVYSQILIFIGTALIIQALIQRPHLYQKQAAVLLAAVLIPWISNGAYIAGLTPIPQLDLTPFAFTLSAVAYTWGISKFQLVDLSPIAREVVMENMRDGVVVLDIENRIVDLNPVTEQLLGIPTRDVVGSGITKPLSVFPELLKRLRTISPDQEKITIQGGPEKKFYELHISPLKDHRKKLNGRLVVIQDITEFVKARDQALESSRLKSQLLARVSHELRTPLAAILGFAELLHDGSYGILDDEQSEMVTGIIESAQDLTAMVNELLDEAQFEVHSVKLQNANFRIKDLVRNVEMKMGMLAITKNLTLQFKIDPNMPTDLWGDEFRLRQILLNLVGNALKFTKQGEVSVKLGCVDDHHWLIEVSDTGIGIPKDAQDSIFEPFHQVDGSITRTYGGSGLGLSIVKHLTELMEGQIHLKSDVQQGSTFTIVLPLVPAKEKV
ncbi:MAG: PAS domain-containing protein [Anaerolineales bacterium]|nr:PAS domain-containing protein [Anaerolineales bacterium]